MKIFLSENKTVLLNYTLYNTKEVNVMLFTQRPGSCVGMFVPIEFRIAVESKNSRY